MTGFLAVTAEMTNRRPRISAEDGFYLDFIKKREGLTTDSAVIHWLAVHAIRRYKVADRPVWKGRKP